MAYQSKRPPIRVIITIEEFNKLVEFFSIGEEKHNDKENKFTRIKNKLLKYSVPYIPEDEIELVEIRFFIDEVIDFIYCFIDMNDINYKTQYYSVLLKVREKLQQKARVQKK